VAANGLDRILVRTRLAAALLTVLLAMAVCLMAAEMFGRSEAIVAMALLTFEPMIIAHGSLVTTDMALAATVVVAVYALYRYRKRRTFLRLVAVGVAVGLMLAAKHSGVLMLPVFVMLLGADIIFSHRFNSGAPARMGWEFLRSAVAYSVVLLVAVGVVWGFYGFRYFALPRVSHESLAIPELFNQGAVFAASRSMTERALEALHDARLLPESYTYGLAYVAATSARPTYILGRVYPTGRWFYFPVAFAIKSSIALLVLLALALPVRELHRTRPREMLFLLLPSLAYFGISLFSSLNIGVRHILPVYPLFAVVAAAGACWWARRRPVYLYSVIALLVLHAVTAARVAPNYIAFANDLWGGTRNVHRYLNETNADWGQNLKLVQAYVTDHDIHACWLAAFAMADLVRPYTTCGTLPGHGWSVTQQMVEVVPPVIDGTVFVSAYELPPMGGPEYAALAQTEPVDVIGGGILVFRGRFEIPLAAALSYAGRANQLLGRQRYAEALQDVRTAVELGPNDPRTHGELAMVAARNGLMDEARREADLSRALSLR